MVDRDRDRLRPTPRGDVLTAASQILHGTIFEEYAVQPRSWANDLWGLIDCVGEAAAVLNWLASGMSRMHLVAGVRRPGLNEPETVTEGPAAEIVQDLVNNARGGESQFLRRWAPLLFVPGEGYLVVREDEDGNKVYDVKAAESIRRSSKRFARRDTANREQLGTYELRTSPDRWLTLDPNNSLVGRIYDPDPRYDYLATSLLRPTLATLREIDLYNRAIIATLLSRIAFNGILFIPEEVTFPVNPQFKDAPDPFIAELVHFASRGIKDPGAPSAAIPFPLRVAGKFIEQFRHLLLASGVDPKVIEGRDSAVKRLLNQMPAPPEAAEGLGDMTHWNAAAQSRENVRLYFAPPMELLCGGLDEVLLWSTLRAAGKKITDAQGDRFCVWYDDSDLTVDTDNSENLTAAYDRTTITTDAYLGGIGMGEDDKPTPEQTREQILVRLATNGQAIPDSFYLLYPQDKPETPPPAAPAVVPDEGAGVAVGPSAPAPSSELSPQEPQ